MREMTPLCQLAIKYSTDKGGRHNTYNHQPNHGTHEYTPSYYDLLYRQRDIVHSVLEIGVNAGGSLRMWEEFFPNAQIVGLDIDTNCLIQSSRISCFQADQSDPHSLKNALQQARHWKDFEVITKYDLIIDDGSHRMDHQATSLKALAPLLSDIGVYIIEDIARLDNSWHDYLLKETPDFLIAGLVAPEFKGTGSINDELLYVATRKDKP